MNKIIEKNNEIGRLSTASLRTKTRAFCPSCKKSVGLMSMTKTVELYQMNFQEIKSLAQKVVLHPVHNNCGELMICEESLFAFFEQRETQLLDKNYLAKISMATC